MQTNIIASHLIGGEMNYQHLGGTTYKINLIYYRDCTSPSNGGGNPSALSGDNPAFISIYNGTSFYSLDTVESYEYISLPVDNPNLCENSSNNTCVDRITFTLIKTLPNSINDYTILNQRCCFGNSMNNINQPGSNGFSIYCTLKTSVNNTSAKFKTLNNSKFCIGKTYELDYSATDMDGDSLSYEFTLLDNGASPDDPKPIINFATLPTIQTTPYLTPYSSTNPAPGISLNPKTGKITLNSNVQGLFLVNIACHEWRNGIKINTVKKTITLRINACNFEVFSKIACEPDLENATNGAICISNCENKTIQFKNNSFGASSYHWDFGEIGIFNDTSSVFEPTYTYTDTGTYKVTLIAQGLNCTDSTTRTIIISNDQLTTDFSYQGNLCTGFPIQFNSQSTSVNDLVTYWKWNFSHDNFNINSNLQNPLIAFPSFGTYDVNLKIFNSRGCNTSITKNLEISEIKVNAYQDTSMIIGNSVQLFASGASTYLWTQSNYGFGKISDSTISNPTFLGTKQGNVVLTVTGTDLDGCSNTDSIKVAISNNARYFVPNAFSPNQDNLNDELKIVLVGYTLKYFKVFNRRGQQVYYSTDINQGWDGKFKNQTLGMDTYFWVACIENSIKETTIVRGDVILIR